MGTGGCKSEQAAVDRDARGTDEMGEFLACINGGELILKHLRLSVVRLHFAAAPLPVPVRKVGHDTARARLYPLLWRTVGLLELNRVKDLDRQRRLVDFEEVWLRR